ncbi:MAG: hypothetical protein A2075_15605 [Geobacteraceae bacterium GWC2_58_44]|nr:MAG: hypothetical protein A2075_15605 [Geobacteraceae bacterium GWC2_58_44]HBG06010.1 hypothetical protein [Geobacter sp.]
MGLRDMISRTFAAKPEHAPPVAEPVDELASACSLFSKLSATGDIGCITFSAGAAQIELKDGRRYHFDAGDRSARMYTVPLTGTFESKETELLRRLIQPGQVCVDVGASFGWYTVLLSRLVGASGRVCAFEPIPHTFSVLSRNISLNGCDNVTLETCALADAAGERDLYLPDCGVSGSLELHPYDSSYESIRCRIETLDWYCKETGVERVDFIKADIEGAEWLLLKGGEEAIRRWQPLLLLEVQAHSATLFGYSTAAIFNWLKERGYSAYFVSAEGELVAVAADTEPLPDYNFLFVPDGKKLPGRVPRP